MNADQGLLIQILRDLAAREAAWNAEADLNLTLRSIYDFLEASGFRRCTEEEIADVVRASPVQGDLHAWGGVLFLRPCETRAWAVPVLTVTYDFGDRSNVGFRLGLFLVDDATEEVVSVGYRFETPDNPGEHSFFHLQHVIELGHGSLALPTPPWMPQTKLAVPVEAHSEVGLLLLLLTSIYGPSSEVLGQIADSAYRVMLAPHLREVTWAT